jgi:lysophospholipase L1-like esterase
MQRAFTTFILVALAFANHLARAATNSFDKWEPEIQKFEAADREQMPPKGGNVFVGSSSIRLWTNLVDAFPKKKIVRRGFGGSTMADALHFADRIVLPYEPKQVFVYEGDNDLAAGKEPATIAAEFRELVRKIHTQNPKTKVWFIAVKPSPSRAKFEAKQRALNSEIEWWCKAHKNVGYIDVWAPMMGADGKPRADIFVKDNLHMNEAGYEIWKKVIGKKL